MPCTASKAGVRSVGSAPPKLRMQVCIPSAQRARRWRQNAPPPRVHRGVRGRAARHARPTPRPSRYRCSAECSHRRILPPCAALRSRFARADPAGNAHRRAAVPRDPGARCHQHRVRTRGAHRSRFGIGREHQRGELRRAGARHLILRDTAVLLHIELQPQIAVSGRAHVVEQTLGGRRKRERQPLRARGAHASSASRRNMPLMPRGQTTASHAAARPASVVHVSSVGASRSTCGSTPAP